VGCNEDRAPFEVHSSPQAIWTSTGALFSSHPTVPRSDKHDISYLVEGCRVEGRTGTRPARAAKSSRRKKYLSRNLIFTSGS